MPYKFDEEPCQLIMEIRGIQKDLLSMQLKLFGSYPSVAPVPSIDYLVMDCILQANEIQHNLLDLRLAIMMEQDLSSLIHPYNATWPGYYFHSEISHAPTPIDNSDYYPHALPSYLSRLEL